MKKEEMGIIDYARRLGARRKLIAYVSIAVFSAVALATFTMKPVYKAVAEVYVDPGSGAELGGSNHGMGFDNSVYMQTQLSVLKSESVARKVVDKLDLDKPKPQKKGLKEIFSGMLKSVWASSGEAKASTLEDADATEKAVRKFERKLGADFTPSSNVIYVSYESEDPATAARVANAAVEAMIDQNMEMKMAPAKESMDWLDTKLKDLRQRISESTANLQAYKVKNGLIATGDSKANISLQGLADLSAKVFEAEANRYQAQVKYEQVAALKNDRNALMAYPDIINSKTIQTLKEQEGDLAKQLAEASRKYGDRHPQMVKLTNEMDAVHKQMDREANLIVAALKTDYREAVRIENGLNKALANQKAEAMSYESLSAEYAAKLQDLESERRAYDEIFRKFRESNIIGNVSISTVQFMQRAVPPVEPVRPLKGMYLAMGLVFAALCGVGFGMAAEYMDETWKDPFDMEENIGVSVLGVVPRNPDMLAREGGGKPLALPKPASAFAEAMRSIKGNIMLRSEENPSVIQVGSASSSEGKSVVALSLACSLALSGEKTVVIDADLRRPSLHRYLRIRKAPGLTSVLSGRVTTDEALIATDVPNLMLLSVGEQSAGASELLRSTEMAELINEMRLRFDRVIIDCPPFLGPADSYMLTRMTDGVVLVVLSGKTNRALVSKTLKDLQAIRATVLGCVLNDAKSRSQHYYPYDYEYHDGAA